MASEWVSILIDGQDMRVYVSQPETTGKAPGVIVIMETFGVNKHIQEGTATLSREGYVAIYPGANHGFNCDERPSYHAEASQDAWARTRSWFQKYLQA